MLLDDVALYVFWPIFPLLDQGRRIDTSLFQLDNPLQHTKATVENNHHALSKDGLQDTKQQSNCFPLIVEFRDDF